MATTEPSTAQYAVRDDLCAALERDLIGPRTANELLEEPPLDRYVTGILYPMLSDQTGIDESQFDEVSDDDGGASADPAVARSNVHYPSSVGITFAVDPATETLSVEVAAARYLPGEDRTWRREQIGPIRREITVAGEGEERLEVVPGLDLYVKVRPAVNGPRSVTVVLLNKLTAQAGHKDEMSFFQTSFVVTGQEAGRSPFVARPRQLDVGDEDLVSNDLLFRDRPEFAVGHGCAAEWQQETDDPQRARSVTAAFLPTHDVRIVESNPEIPYDRLGFEDLAAASAPDLVASLTPSLAATRAG